MRLLILFNSLMVGGSERKGVRITNEFFHRGQFITVAYLCGPHILLPEINNRIPTACLERSGKFSLKAVLNLRRYILEHDISVVLCMNQYPLLYATLVKLTLMFKKRIKVILAVNTTEFERKRDRWFMLIYAPLIRRAGAVIYGCKYQMNLWRNKYKLEKVRSSVIYNGVDSTFFDPAEITENLKAQLGLSKKCVIGCVGRLDVEKNQAALIRVVAQLNHDTQRFAVLLVGSGPERDNLESLAEKLGVSEQVIFLGRMDDVRTALATMDVFVLPSVSVETFSNAALEAMAMSVPVVLSNIGGASEMVVDDENGFLYERHDVARLADLLVKLESDEQLRRRLGRCARDTVLTQFSFTRMVDDYERALSDT